MVNSMEKWRDIPGYEGIYEASTEGRIRTKEGKTTHSVRNGERHWKQRVLKQKAYFNKKGRADARVCLWKNGNEKTFLVARLVAMTWVDGYSPKLTVNHIDGDHTNNRADNLEWMSLADNVRHGFEHRLIKTQIPVVIIENGEMSLHRSMAEASRALGKNSGYLSNKYKKTG